MRSLALLGAAAMVLAVAAFYGSYAAAGEYDNCYTPAPACMGTCATGTCVPKPTTLAPVQCPNGNKQGYRHNNVPCGECLLFGLFFTGDTCGQPLSSEPCF